MPETEHELKGELISYGKIKSGTKGDKEWTLYSYTIKTADGKEKKLSGFRLASDFLGRNVAVTYEENGQYNNLKTIECPELDSQSENELDQSVKEADKQYNVVPVGLTFDEKKIKEILFGQILNKTIDWMIGERNIDPASAVDFNKIFDNLWNKALEKRKEKLGY